MKVSSSIINLVLGFVVLFLFSSCSKNDDETSYDIAGSWKVVYFKEGYKKITKTADNTWVDINNGDITANFTEPDSLGKGTISGITVTNGYIGNYTILSKGEISVGPVTTTYINEPEWTDLFVLQAAEKFEVRNSKLFIYYNNNKNVIVLERK